METTSLLPIAFALAAAACAVIYLGVRKPASAMTIEDRLAQFSERQYTLEGVMHFANFRCISLIAANQRTFAMFCVIRCQPWTVRRPFDAVVGASASAVIAYVRGCLRSQVHNTL